MEFPELEHITDRPRMKPGTRRRRLRIRRNPVQQVSFRKRKAKDTLPDLALYDGPAIKGEDRCRAIGLPAGDCRQHRRKDSSYCFYHDKLQRGLTTPTADLYPVWPLPEEGYVFLKEEEVEQAWVA